MKDKIKNKTRTLTAKWSVESPDDIIGRMIHEESLTEEEKIIERLKYTQKERNEMYQQSLNDMIVAQMTAQLTYEIDKEALEKMKRIVTNGKIDT